MTDNSTTGEGLHLPSDPEETTEQKLAWAFRQIWKVFIEGGGLDGFELQDVIEKSGLAEWRPVTAEEAAAFDCDIEEGEPALFLNAEGQSVNRLAKEVENHRGR